MTWLGQSTLLVFALALVGGLVPLVFQRTERLQHLLIALAAGVFLGGVFLHMLPEAAGLSLHGGAGGEHVHGDLTVWGGVLAGVVLLFLLENLVLRTRTGEEHSHRDHSHRDHGHGAAHDHDHSPDHGHGHAQVGDEDEGCEVRHRTVGYATFFGLSVHGFTAGLGLSLGEDLPDLQDPLLLSIVSHKAVEGFSLATAFLLAGMARGRILLCLVAFALVTPAGLWMRVVLGGGLGGQPPAILLGLAAGTFLFVALYDLLPEVFHRREDQLVKVVLLAAGIGLSLALGSLAP